MPDLEPEEMRKPGRSRTMNNKKSNNNQLLMTLLKGRTFIVLVLLVIFFTIVKGTTFLSASTLTMVAKNVDM